MLKMKSSCEKCGIALQQDGRAFICSFECTFCEACARQMSNVCPNCQGNLVERPARVRKVADVAVSQIKSRIGQLFGR